MAPASDLQERSFLEGEPIVKICSCGHPVSKGNQHAKSACPPKAKPGENRRARKRVSRRSNGVRKLVPRTAVPGTGKPKEE